MKRNTTRGKPFEPGHSGNPSGRPKGSGTTAKLRAELAEHVPEIVQKLVEQAKAGDPQASRLILERVLPALRPAEQTTRLTLPDESLADKGRAVLDAVADGELAPGQAAQLLGGLGSLAKLIETDELERRIAALEERHGNKPEQTN